VLGAEGSGAHTRIQVNFADNGSNWLVYSYANLTALWPTIRRLEPASRCFIRSVRPHSSIRAAQPAALPENLCVLSARRNPKAAAVPSGSGLVKAAQTPFLPAPASMLRRNLPTCS
jgi:hypothetical protein